MEWFGIVFGAIALLVTIVDRVLSAGRWVGQQEHGKSGNGITHKDLRELEQRAKDDRHKFREELSGKLAQYYTDTGERVDEAEKRFNQRIDDMRDELKLWRGRRP